MNSRYTERTEVYATNMTQALDQADGKAWDVDQNSVVTEIEYQTIV